MDSLRAFDDGPYLPAEDEPTIEPPPAIGNDERRMIVRAYNHWVSMLTGRDYPSVEDLEPGKLGDFGPHGVLLDFTAGANDPGIAFIGDALRAECGLGDDIRHVGQVPKRSLLSRLTDHYLQIIANRAPIGFEAEFVSSRGATTAYRGILMPLSSDGDTIDFIYGVINWKEMADAATQATLVAQLSAALGGRDAPLQDPARRDGPSADPEPSTQPARPAPVLSLVRDEEPAEGAETDEYGIPATDLPDDAGLGDRLLVARESADQLKAADGRSRAALYRALGQAYDFALAAEDNEADYLELLEDSGLTRQERAPMTPIVKLVFGADTDKARVTEFAAALAHGRRQAIGTGGFTAFLERQQGGLKALVAAERAHRRPAKSGHDALAAAKAKLAAVPALARVEGIEAAGDYVLLLARREADGSLSVIAADTDEAGLARALRTAACAR